MAANMQIKVAKIHHLCFTCEGTFSDQTCGQNEIPRASYQYRNFLQNNLEK